MDPALVLSLEEFNSLALIGSGPFLGPSIPEDHLIKLAGLRYIHVLHGCFEATVSGQLRIAGGY
jgi:hypothetical protein